MNINIQQCCGCGSCLQACPKHLLQISADYNSKGTHYCINRDPASCVNCGQCELMCTAKAITSKPNKAHALFNYDIIPKHAGCNFGTLSNCISDVMTKMNIVEDFVIFTQAGTYLGLNCDLREYTNGDYYQDALDYKAAHPDQTVLLICASTKPASCALSRERYLSLTNENVTIINALSCFEADDDYTALVNEPNRTLEEVAALNKACYLARGNLRTPQNVRTFENYLEQALLHQQKQDSFSIVELVYPCYYRMAHRPEKMMDAQQLAVLNQ